MESTKVTPVFRPNIRFRCRRCAALCCKLGGPRLSGKDLHRLKQAGAAGEEFVDERTIKSKPNGECVFLRQDPGTGLHQCAVYEHRPTLCRVYPLSFQSTEGPKCIVDLLPCRGLSTRVGEPVNEEFVRRSLRLFLQHHR